MRSYLEVRPIWTRIWSFRKKAQIAGIPRNSYEAGLEGVALFVILTILNRWPTPPGTMFWTFICGYGVARFFVEFFREPDSHLGFIFQWISMGQLLCIPMVAVGMFMIVRSCKRA